MLMGNAMMLRLIPVYESFFRGDKDRWRRNSGALSYVACKLGRRPWRLSGLHGARVAKLGGFRALHGVRIAKLGRFRGLHGVRVAK